MSFPFAVPEDLTALSADEFTAFRNTVTEYARPFTAMDSTASAEDTLATAALFRTVNAESARRDAERARQDEEAASLAAARADLAAFTTQPTPDPEPTPDPVPAPRVVPAAPVAAAAPTAVVASTIDLPPVTEAPRRAVLVASSDVPNAGASIASFADAGAMIERRLASYGAPTGGRGKAVARTGNRVKIGGRTMNRHGVVNFQRQYDNQLRITDANQAMGVLEYAANQTRLAGGSLAEAMRRQVENGKSLTAAVGWCAPSETIYDLCELETLDGILDIPEVQASRGGFFIPENGGPDFSTIYDSIGDDGDVILSEYDVENGADKVCVEIPCPDFVEVRLDVAYVCLTGSLLQRRGYPEAVTRFSRGAMVALAHKVNESVIARMVAQSGAATVIPAQAANTDGASQILSAAEIGATDMRYRHRMSTTATLEMVLPVWALAPIRAAIARRAGVAELAVTDAEILAWFRVRNVVPRFVYDWQDAYSTVGLQGAPGAATPITALPANVSFLLYPAGTWVKPVQDVVNLDTVYDNALLTQNQYTALFAEDGFNVLKMCAESRLYTTPLNPQGVTGQSVA